MGGPAEPDGLDRRRAVQVITTCGTGPGGRGSGYQVAGNVVLTAAHVVCGAATVWVRFLTEDGGTREVQGEPFWVNSAADVALIALADAAVRGPGAGSPAGAAAAPVRFARVAKPVECEALGFPRFRLRAGTSSPDGGAAVSYRDSHHARGETTPLSNQREGSLEITLKSSPEQDPQSGRSPWEGMSGAPVWSGGYMIGVITKHHRSDGLGTLAASPVDRWYRQVSPQELGELSSLIGLPVHPGGLEELPAGRRFPVCRSCGRRPGCSPPGWPDNGGGRNGGGVCTTRSRSPCASGAPTRACSTTGPRSGALHPGRIRRRSHWPAASTGSWRCTGPSRRAGWWCSARPGRARRS